MPDSHTLDRIDVRYAVRTRTTFDREDGPVVVEGSFLLTLGTYAGIPDPDVIGRNINDRGVHLGDVESVAAESGGCPSIVQGVEMLAARGIAEADIVSVRIAAVLVDDQEIAQSFERDEDGRAATGSAEEAALAHEIRTSRDQIVVVEIDESGGNAHHVLAAARHAAWRSDADGSDLLELVHEHGTEFDTWTDAAAHVAAAGDRIADVIAVEGDRDGD